MRIIDAHNHPDWHGHDFNKSLENMDRFGIEKTWLLSWESPHSDYCHNYSQLLPSGVLGSGREPVPFTRCLSYKERAPERFILGYCPDPREPDACRRLIAAHDGDVALLYIYLLRRGQAPDAQLRRELGWEPGRLAAAVGRLAAAGLLTGSDAPPAAPAEVLPEYTAQELVRRSGEDPAFRSILAEAESLLGRTLSGADTRALFGVYDYLGGRHHGAAAPLRGGVPSQIRPRPRAYHETDRKGGLRLGKPRDPHL